MALEEPVVEAHVALGDDPALVALAADLVDAVDHQHRRQRQLRGERRGRVLDQPAVGEGEQLRAVEVRALAELLVVHARPSEAQQEARPREAGADARDRDVVPVRPLVPAHAEDAGRARAGGVAEVLARLVVPVRRHLAQLADLLEHAQVGLVADEVERGARLRAKRSRRAW